MGICKFIEKVCETVETAFIIFPYTIGPIIGPVFPTKYEIMEKKDK